MQTGFRTTLNIIENRPKPQNQWMNNYIQPGAVGSVGDAHIAERLKHNQPNAPIRWEAGTVGKEAIVHGSFISDGAHLNTLSDGGGAITFDSNWESGRNFKTSLGWIYQDLRELDKRVEPIMGETPDYSWNNKIATVNRAFVSGDKFLPLPGGYAPPNQNTNLRGGAFPTVQTSFVSDAPPGGYVPVSNFLGSGGPTKDYAYSMQNGLAIGASNANYGK